MFLTPNMLPNGPKHVLYIVENYFWTYKNTLRHFLQQKKTIFGQSGGGCNR